MRVRRKAVGADVAFSAGSIQCLHTTQPHPRCFLGGWAARCCGFEVAMVFFFSSSSPSSKKHTVYIPFRHIKRGLTCGRLCASKSTKQAWSTSTQQSATTLKTTSSSRNRLVTTQSAGKPKERHSCGRLNTLLQIECSPNGAGVLWWHSSPSRMMSAARPQQTSQKPPKEHDKKPKYLSVASNFPTSKSSLVLDGWMVFFDLLETLLINWAWITQV